jgi:hypothetical protein
MMTNSAKQKGSRGELEVQTLLRKLLGISHIRRALGAGRHDDVGDIDNIPNTIIQVAYQEAIIAAIRKKLPETEQQRKNARKMFSALFIRRNRNPWIVVMTPEMYAKYWKYAQKGLALEKKQKFKINHPTNMFKSDS